MKKFFSFLLITILMACSFKYTPSFANPVPLPNWTDPGITEIINLSDLTGWMQNGGVFDVSNFQDAEEFLTWYFQIRVPYIDDNGEIGTAPAFGNSTFNFVPGTTSYSDITNPRGVITNSFREHTGYGRTFQSNYENYALTDGNLMDMPFQLQDRRSIANFNLYKYDSLTDYINNFVTDEPIPNPDENYVSYINLINGSGFWWKDFNNSSFVYNGDTYNFLYKFPPSSYSWICKNKDFSIPYSNISNVDNMSAVSILNLYINSVGDLYNFNLTVNVSDFCFYGTNGSNTRLYYNTIGSINSSGEFYSYNSNQTSFSNVYSVSGSLADVFNYIQSRFRNVNIYVNGELWALAGSNEDTPAPEFPEVVGGDELPVQTWPLTIPRAPAYITGNGLLNGIQHAIDTDGQFDFGDLVGNITDEEGNTLTDGDFITVPVGDTMPNPNPDPDDVTGTPTPPVPDPDTIPVLPGPIHDAFTGTTILAELVDATQTALPDELITVFWGILFILFILGIIKILHK